MMQIREENLEKLLKFGAIFGIAACCILLIPQVRILIIEIGEKFLGRSLDHNIWIKLILNCSLYMICLFSCILIPTIKNVQIFFENHSKYIEKIFIFVSIGIVVMSVIVRIIMYLKCRSLWLDEAALAQSIVTRNYLELLVTPLINDQSAPVLYVIAVKSICGIFGYSEISLRIFSLFAFLCLLICETVFMKKAFNLSNQKIAFVVIMSALLPSYIWYSNELKPYMSDALFAVLTILLYFYYTQNRIKLPILTALYILILGFSSPAIFFIGGALFSEFLISGFNKNKKTMISVFLSGAVILAIFGLYYHWWLSPASEYMKTFWDDYMESRNIIYHIVNIFETVSGDHTPLSLRVIWGFVPFALLGFYSLIRKNKIVYSIGLSMFFVFLASAIGKWPLIGRLWLFLPVIILIFTPIGFDFIYDKIKRKKITDIIIRSFLFIIIIIYSVNSIKYIGDKTYFSGQEVNPLIQYVKENIKEEEKLYVYWGAKNTFNYKNGYGSTKIGNVTKDNIIYGIDAYEWDKSIIGNELQSILENEKTYLIFQYYWVGIDNGLAILRNYGTLTEVMNAYDTPLYYFERNIDYDVSEK